MTAGLFIVAFPVAAYYLGLALGRRMEARRERERLHQAGWRAM